METNTTKVVDNNGSMKEVSMLSVDTKRISNFVEAYRSEYFEQHSLDWALDTIIERGIAEIKRYVKTNHKREQDVARATVVKEFGLTPEQARELLKAALAMKLQPKVA